MSAIAAVAVTVLLVIAAVRLFVLWRARAAARGQPRPAVNADGVLVGAEPLQLVGTGDRGILLLHGFNDTPQSVEQLAHALHRRGWSVSVPLLPHHGRGSDAFATKGNAVEWVAHARREWIALQSRAPRSVLAGQSMGGAIAVILAAEDPPDALVLLAPYLTMGRFTSLLASMWPVWQLVVPRLVSDSRRGLRDPQARTLTLGGGQFTPRLVYQLKRVVSLARGSSAQVTVPTLVLHARSDYRIPSDSASRAFARLPATDKTLIWRDRTGHVLAADVGYEEVSAIVNDWLDAKVPPDSA